MEVNVVECNRLGHDACIKQIKEAVSHACFVALDFEFSGISNYTAATVTLDEKYGFFRNIVNSGAIISIGISCFFWDTQGKVFTHKSWDLLTLCMEPFAIMPHSAEFLIRHGFDFNHLFMAGIPYRKAQSNEKQSTDQENVSKPFALQSLMDHLLLSQKPVVFHNGFVDLLFFYNTFYAPLPTKVETFKADLVEVFLGGVYDTKFVGAKHIGAAGLFLDYLFWNTYYFTRNETQKFFSDDRNNSGGKPVNTWKVLARKVDLSLTKKDVCAIYSKYGQCHTESCMKSHDIHLIVQIHQRGDPTKKRRHKEKAEETGSQNGREEGDKLKSKCCEENSDKRLNILNCDTKNGKLRDFNDESKTVDRTENLDTSNGSYYHRLKNKDENDINERIPGNSECNSSGNGSKTETGNYQNSSDLNGERSSAISSKINKSDSESHRAGRDAFMTGFVFAHFLYTKFCGDVPMDFSNDPSVGEYRNRMFLRKSRHSLFTGDTCTPLWICKSAFASSSAAHKRKYEELHGTAAGK